MDKEKQEKSHLCMNEIGCICFDMYCEKGERYYEYNYNRARGTKGE